MLWGGGGGRVVKGTSEILQNNNVICYACSV